MLDDKTYLELFASRALGPEHFDHRGHLRLAWLHLVHFTEEEARQRVCSGIRELATRFGAPEKFNHTLTEALMRIIELRMRGQVIRSFDAFLRENPDLLNDAKSLLDRHYSAELLNSDRARTNWVEPDRDAIQ
ncbi:hypothetical protein GCM10011352_10680 [Marinobacterium zhoushanense]|uniref:Uncharacterized protein n=1 Tax=Marinobacterium zhoushanense TaxID=1679163 RepID=A0ABQ1K4V0_9GAMM|nr:hypothetical protein [Marinobacterium zhoushanense]GGB86649.1 hypothetical protein GCM10011352_10680 [Marinobacterium zhoushanense]